MIKDDFLIHKQSLIKSRRQNIHNSYEFHAKQLGKGAYGVVYKAKQKGSSEWRAVKKINKKNIKNPQVLINQIQILKTLDHPSCIKLYQTFEDQQSVYLVTDLCQGGQLFDRLDSDGNFSQEDARKIFVQIMEAISYCHTHKIAHRDLKPENFMFLNKVSLDLKLIDFGLSYRWKQNMKNQLSAKGQKKLIGTSYYIAPQIIKGSYDQRCDVWSAGVILYILLSAVPPFDGQSDKQIIEQVRKMKYQMEIPEMSKVSKDAKQLINNILQAEQTRLTIQQIFNCPWIKKQTSKHPLKVNFNKLTSFSKYSKLKKLSALMIATQLSEKDVQQLGNLFKQLDLNKDGQISIQELNIALKEQNTHLPIKQLADLMQSIDIDKNGKINYSQFLASCMDQSKLFTEQHIHAVFNRIDRDGNGYVQKEELSQMFMNNGIITMNGKSVLQIINTCDKDGNGKIDYNQFKNSILE